MTGQVKMFTSLVDDAGDHEQVSLGDNSKGRISGLGEISLTNDLSLSNVLFVDSCSYNLLSIAQFCDLGLSCTFVTPGFKDKSECIEYMCARIKLHTCIDSVYTKTQC
jgi:hypothetical protein